MKIQFYENENEVEIELDDWTLGTLSASPEHEHPEEPETLDDGIELLAAPNEQCIEIKLGSMDIPEIKTDICWIRIGPIRTKVPCIKTRTCRKTLFADICVSNDISSDLRNILISCAKSAFGGAAIIAVIASPALYVPAFKVTLLACLASKGADAALRNIKVGLKTRKKCGSWKRRV